MRSPLDLPRFLLPGAVALAAVLTAGCGDDGGSTTTLSATLVSPGGSETAAVLELVGPGLRNAGSAVARTFSHRRNDTLVVVLVSGTPRTLTFTVDADDPQRLPEVRILEVADVGERLVTDLGDFRVEFGR